LRWVNYKVMVRYQKHHSTSGAITHERFYYRICNRMGFRSCQCVIWSVDGIEKKSRRSPMTPQQPQEHCDHECVCKSYIRTIEKQNKMCCSGYIRGKTSRDKCRDDTRSRPSPAAPEQCIWAYDEFHSKWDTQCDHGFHFMDEMEANPSFKFCPYCGKPILKMGGAP